MGVFLRTSLFLEGLWKEGLVWLEKRADISGCNLSVRISGSEESLKENLLSVYPAALETWKVLHSESVQTWALYVFGASGFLHNRSKQVNMR